MAVSVQADYAEQPRFTEWASPSERRQELDYLEARGPGGIGSAGQRGRQTALDFQQQQQQQQQQQRSRVPPRTRPGEEAGRSFQRQQGQQPPEQLRSQPTRGQQQPRMNDGSSESGPSQEQDDEDDLEERVARIFRQQ